MRKSTLIVLLLFGLVWAVPSYGPSSFVESSGAKIDVGYYGAPCMVDWNQDGYQDMVLGQFTSGKIRFYENTDQSDSPVFSGFTYIKSDGVDITLPSG